MNRLARAAFCLCLAVFASSTWAAAFRIDMTATVTESLSSGYCPFANPSFDPFGMANCSPPGQPGQVYTATFFVLDSELQNPGNRNVAMYDFYATVDGVIWSQNPLSNEGQINSLGHTIRNKWNGVYNLELGGFMAPNNPPRIPATIQNGTIVGFYDFWGVFGPSDQPFLFFYPAGDNGFETTNFFADVGYQTRGTFVLQQIGRIPEPGTLLLLLLAGIGFLGQRVAARRA